MNHRPYGEYQSEKIFESVSMRVFKARGNRSSKFCLSHEQSMIPLNSLLIFKLTIGWNF